MPRVAFITTDFPPLPGGIARLCWHVAGGLAGIGWEVTVIAPGDAGSAAPQGVRVLRVPGRGLPCWARMARAVRAVAPLDALMCATWYPDGLIAAASRPSLPVIVWAHGNELYDRSAEGIRWCLERPRRLARDMLLRRAAAVLANSDFTAQLVREVVPDGARVAVIPLGTEPAVFRPGIECRQLRERLRLGDRRLLLTVARLAPYKGHASVMRAVRALRARHALSYLIVGEGPARASLAALAEELGIADLVRFAGHVAEADLPAYYALADVFVLCTEERRAEASVEGFGIALLEAAACELPVVAMRSGGIPDAVADGETGLLVPPGNERALSDALDRVLTEPRLAAGLGSAGRKRVLARFTWDETAAQVAEVLRRTASQPRQAEVG